MIKYYIILIFLSSSFLIAGPLDIESIKKECLKKHKNESSEEFTECLKIKINNILYYKEKKL